MFYHKLGEIPHKRHTQFYQPNGELYYEELIGAEGFSSISALAYHLHPPTAVAQVGGQVVWQPKFIETPFLQHRHIWGKELAAGGDWLSGRTYIMGNADVRLALCRPTQSMAYFYKNAQADEMVFIHEGSGKLLSPLGVVHFRAGDYVYVPRTLVHQWVFDEGVVPRALVIESFSQIYVPKRYINKNGQFLEHSPFCERDIRPPEDLQTIDEKGHFEVKIAKHGFLHSLFLQYHPYDVVGWDGYFYPYAFSIHDFEPITGRVHQPPPVHQNFEAHNFVICSFVPRLYDYHPLSIPAPYNHSNIDSDEVLYYVEGNFMSRKGIAEGSFTLHPGGIPHGPHPGTYEGSIGKTKTEELAVMVDTFRPLYLTKEALDLEDEGYMLSWKI